MNKKILTLLAVFLLAFSIASVCAEGLISHDFGKFKMDIPDAPNGEIAEKEGGVSVNHTIYAIPNPDGTNFAYIDYLNTTHTNGNNNTTDFVLSKIKENYTVNIEDGIPTWAYEDTHDTGYLVSSDDDTQVLIIQGSDIYLKDAVDSVEFK
jgi:hypothetical protein